MLSPKRSSPKPLIIAGVAGLLLWFLIPTVSHALDVNDKGAIANGLWLVQTAVGFAGVVALITAARTWRSQRTSRRQAT